jgi:hypothetical protein
MGVECGEREGGGEIESEQVREIYKEVRERGEDRGREGDRGRGRVSVGERCWEGERGIER